MLNRFKVNKTFKNRSKMHYVSKESSNKELIWIRKMTKRKKKPSNGRNEQNAYWQISRKETLYKKKYWVFLESADRLFLKKRRNASSI